MPPVDADGVIDLGAAPSAPGGSHQATDPACHGTVRELGITDRAERLVRTGELVGRTVGSWNDVTPDEAERVLTALAHQRQGVA
jgi:hypothetical protein